MAPSEFFLSAGDPSGDNAAGRLVAELRKLHPGLSFFGLGGSKLKQLGQRQLADGSDLAVLGFWGVARRFRFFQKLLRRTVDEIRSRRPACLILVDYPGFNLRLARQVRDLRIPVVYYISPQVWAWGKKRLAEIKESVSLMLVILPFEMEMYKQSRINSRFVGHYLLEDIPSDYIASPPPTEGTLALLPGSRPQEIERMLPPMIEAAGIMHERYGVRSVVAAVTGAFDYERHAGHFKTHGVSVAYDNARKTVFDSNLVLCSSGTATLKAGIIGRPMVVVYKTGFVTYQIARRLIKVDKIALVNLVLAQKCVPELIQRAATPRRMVGELEKLWTDEAHYEAVRGKLNRLPQLLGGEGASARAAGHIAELVWPKNVGSSREQGSRHEKPPGSG